MEIFAKYSYSAKDYHKFGVFHVFRKSWFKTFRLPILMMAAAIMMRWSMPPEHSCGYL